MLYDSYDVEVLADRLEMEAEVIREMNELTNFEFTFKTEAEYWSARITGYIPDYKCVRFHVTGQNGGTIDYPVHNEEEYYETLARVEKHGDSIIKIYPSVTFYESEYIY